MRVRVGVGQSGMGARMRKRRGGEIVQVLVSEEVIEVKIVGDRETLVGTQAVQPIGSSLPGPYRTKHRELQVKSRRRGRGESNRGFQIAGENQKQLIICTV